jgi:hypothetical protein
MSRALRVRLFLIPLLMLAGCGRCTSSSSTDGAPAPNDSSESSALEPAPQELSTLAQSFEATPAWAQGSDLTVGQAKVDFDSLAPLHGDRLGPLLLACQVKSKQGTDQISAPDMNYKVTMEGLPSFSIRGSKDQRVDVFTIPLVMLERDASIAVSVSDRDVFDSEQLGSISVRFGDRLPMAAENASLVIKCRGMSRKDFEPRLQPALASIDQRPADVDEESLSLTQKEFGPAVGLVGWADPRIQRRVKEFNRLLVALGKKTGKPVLDPRPPRPVGNEDLVELTKRLAPASSYVAIADALELTVTAVECGAVAKAYAKHPSAWRYDDPFDCLIRMRGRARKKTSCNPHRCGGISFLSLSVVQPKGKFERRGFDVFDLVVAGNAVKSVELAAGEEVEFVLLPRDSSPSSRKNLSAAPQLHLLTLGNAYLRLPSTTKPPAQ